jgi:hypothetical protein
MDMDMDMYIEMDMATLLLRLKSIPLRWTSTVIITENRYFLATNHFACKRDLKAPENITILLFRENGEISENSNFREKRYSFRRTILAKKLQNKTHIQP